MGESKHPKFDPISISRTKSVVLEILLLRLILGFDSISHRHTPGITDHPVSIQQIPEVVRHFSDLGKLGVQLRDEVFRNSKSRRGRWNIRVVYRSLEGIFVDYDCFVSHNHTGKKNERNYEKNAKILKKNQPEN